MKNLIIYAHPNTKGHCSVVLDEIKSKIKDYEVIDLYKIKYDPVLRDEELYSAGKKKVSKQNKTFQNKIKKAKNLIFVYPNWWNSPPAILKGFLDRVLVSGFAFSYEGKIPKGLLKGKKAAIFVTTGAPTFFYKLFERSIASRIVERYTMKFCGIKAKSFVIGNAKRLTDSQENKIKKVVKKGLNWLF